MEKKIPSGTELLNPRDILRRAGIGTKMIVADFGCGNAGFFALQASHLVGDDGVVYAVDVQKEALTSVQGAAKQQGLHNITTVWSDLEKHGATKILSNSVDVGLVINVLFQSTKIGELLTEVVRMLKPGATLVVVDWKNIPTPLGPPQQLRVTPESIRMHATRLDLIEKDSFEAGPFHFGLQFQKK